MEPSYQFFENRACRYFPCHKGIADFNCLFCYCPMYFLKSCPGNPSWIERDGVRIKNCAACTYPHRPENYENIMKVLGHAIRTGNS